MSQTEKINLLTRNPNGDPDVQHAFSVVKNGGSGDCLFLALSQAGLNLNGQVLNATEVRQAIVAYATRPENWTRLKLNLMNQHEAEIPAFRTANQNQGKSSGSGPNDCGSGDNSSSKKSESGSSGVSDQTASPNENIDEDEALKEAYRAYMLKKGVYGTTDELLIGTELFQFNCSVLRREGGGWAWFSRRAFNYEVMHMQHPEGAEWPRWLYFRFSGDPRWGHWESLVPLTEGMVVRTLTCGSYTEVGFSAQLNMRYFSNWEKAGGLKPTEMPVFIDPNDQGSVPSQGGTKRAGSPLPGMESSPKKLRSECSSSSADTELEVEPLESCPDRKRGAECLECGSCGNPQPPKKKSRSRHGNESCGDGKNKRKRSPSPSPSEKSCCSKKSKPCGSPSVPVCALPSPFYKKRVLITAGSQGLGRRLVKRLYEEGATVFVIDNDGPALEALRIGFPEIETFCSPCCSWDEAKKFIKSISPLDHLVNNAGLLIPIPFLDVQEKDVASTFKTNYTWLFGVAQAFAQGIIEKKCKGGTIVNLTTMFEKWALPEASLFCGSQAAMSMLTRSLALELGCHDIRVNTVKSFLPPNGVDYACTAEQKKRRADKMANYLAFLEGKGMLAEEMLYDDVVNAVLFLLGPNSNSITANELVVNSGISEH